MALKRLVTACLAFISVICIAGCSFFDDVVHLKNDNEAILASDQNRMLLQALAEEYNASQSKYKVWLAEENAGKGQKQPDIYLLEFSKLVNLEQQNKLLKFDPKLQYCRKHLKAKTAVGTVFFMTRQFFW